MKRVIFLLFFCSTIYGLLGQDKTAISQAKSDLHVSLFGDASIIAFNLERRFPVAPKLFLTAKVGVGAGTKFCFFGCSNPYLTLPHHITVNWGKNKRFLELGLGGIGFPRTLRNNYILYPILGFRFLFSKNHESVGRLFLTYPLNDFDRKQVSFSVFGCSLGTRF